MKYFPIMFFITHKLILIFSIIFFSIGCYPVKIFGVVRHGTRTPGGKVVNKVKQIISNVKWNTGTQDLISILKGTFSKWKLFKYVVIVMNVTAES